MQKLIHSRAGDCLRADFARPNVQQRSKIKRTAPAGADRRNKGQQPHPARHQDSAWHVSSGKERTF